MVDGQAGCAHLSSPFLVQLCAVLEAAFLAGGAAAASALANDKRLASAVAAGGELSDASGGMFG